MLSTGEVGNLRAEARTALGNIEAGTLGTAQGAVPPAANLEQPPSPGDRVWIATFSAEGIVRGIHGQYVEVEVRGKRMRVPMSALRKPGKEVRRKRRGIRRAKDPHTRGSDDIQLACRPHA